MNKISTVAAMVLFGFMAGAAQADDMASEDGMMKDDMKGSMENHDMKKDGMSDSMGHDMKKEGMSDNHMGMKDDGMGMKGDKAMHDDMKDGMKGDGMDKSDSMN